jgi:type IV pilus assembly protein PilY1
MAMLVKLLPYLLLGVFSALSVVHRAGADDIDIYLNGAGTGQSYVHILLDVNTDHGVSCTYGSDCAPPFMSRRAYQFLEGKYAAGEVVNSLGILQAVLYSVLAEPALDKLNVALLISNYQFNASLAQPEKTGGGSILLGYQQLGKARSRLQETLRSIPVQYPGEPHALQPRESFYEWYRYITGGPVALGTNTAGNFGQALPTPGHDPGIINSGRYVTPFADASACPRLYAIVASLGGTADDEDLDAEIAASLSLATGGSFQQLLAYLHHPDTDLLPALDATVPLRKTWVIAARYNAAEAEGYAQAGGAGAVLYLDDPGALEAALVQALAAVASAQSGLTPASVAVDVGAQGRFLNALYVALFQPSGAALWSGNVKKYGLLDNPVSGGRQNIAAIVDALGAAAFEPSGVDSGRIRFDALSYWTDVTTLPPGDGITVPLAADGREVARGGAGQKIDGFVTRHIGDANGEFSAAGEPARQLYVEPPTGVEFLPFNADLETLSTLGELLDPLAELDAAARLELLRWARGQDVDNGKRDARRWLLGDVLHSRPLALNYGAVGGHSEENPLVRLFFGSGDGLFHSLEDTDRNGAHSGREIFAFYPRQMLPNIIQWRNNELPAGYKLYGVDGPPVALRVDRNRDGKLDPDEGDEAYVYFGLRRGGRTYYALDVSDPTGPPVGLENHPCDRRRLCAVGPGFLHTAGRPRDVRTAAQGCAGICRRL